MVSPLGSERATQGESRAIGDLASFLAPVTVDEFRRAYWESKHLVTAADPSRLTALEAILPPDVRTLIARHEGACSAWLETLDGEPRAVSVRGADAVSLYDAGMTLYLTDVRVLATFAEALARDLGVPMQRVVCGVFASRRSAGAPCHFDANENFTVQVRGTKRWRIAANADVDAPLTNWIVGRAVPPSIRAATVRALPRAMPPHAETVTLRPGATLYVPRGHWHETMAGEDSLSVNVLYKPLTFGDAIGAALDAALAADPAWRRGAEGLAFDGDAEGARIERLDALRRFLDRCPPQAFVGAGADSRDESVDPNGLYMRNPFARIEVGETDANGDVIVRFDVSRAGHARTGEATFDPSFVAPCVAIARSPIEAVFGVTFLEAAGLSQDEAAALLSILLRVGFVLRARKGAPR